MNSTRERILGIVVGCLAVLIGGYFLQRWVAGKFATRTARIEQLTGDLKKANRQVALIKAAQRKIAASAEQSLPANPEEARSLYQTWLVGEMELAGLVEPDVRLQTMQTEKDLFTKQVFTVEANGTLPQVVELLHAFYSVDWLHRITLLKLRPVKESKLLDVTLNIETISMLKAVATDSLPDRKSNRLQLASRDAYYDLIVGRNLFGPRNSEPKISISGSQDVFLGREVDLSVKWEDADWLDQVYLSLAPSPITGAKLDTDTGKFTWTPTEAGTFEFYVEGIDDGFPAKRSNREKIVINVKEQPKPKDPGPQFDPAKFTLLTALLDIDGQGEIWLHVRPTGQMVTLHKGDKFEIGTIKGTVSEIGEYDFCFDFEGKRRKLSKGELLDQAKVIGDLPAAPATNPVGAEADVQAKPGDRAS